MITYHHHTLTICKGTYVMDTSTVHNTDATINFEYKKKAHDNAFHSFGTYYIFKKRYDGYKNKTLSIATINLLVPSIFGAIYISFGANILTKELSISICAGLGFISICATVISFILRWQEKVTESQKNMIDNYGMYEKYYDIAIDTSLIKEKFEEIYFQLSQEGKYIDRASLEAEISDKEKRRGHRAALIQLQRDCVSCNVKPKSMKSSKCNVCGNF